MMGVDYFRYSLNDRDVRHRLPAVRSLRRFDQSNGIVVYELTAASHTEIAHVSLLSMSFFCNDPRKDIRHS